MAYTRGVQTEDMYHRQTGMVIVSIFIILAVLGALAAVAVPHAGQMLYQSAAKERQAELLRIESAVAAMLRDSPSGALTPAGPTADFSLVHTADAAPLYLADYLEDAAASLGTGCRYSFTADGIVTQYKK